MEKGTKQSSCTDNDGDYDCAFKNDDDDDDDEDDYLKNSFRNNGDYDYCSDNYAF